MASRAASMGWRLGPVTGTVTRPEGCAVKFGPTVTICATWARQKGHSSRFRTNVSSAQSKHTPPWPHLRKNEEKKAEITTAAAAAAAAAATTTGQGSFMHKGSNSCL